MALSTIIAVKDVSKTFKLPHEKNSSLKSAVVNFWRHNKGYEKQRVLRDVSLEVEQGEFFGIVGRNGSGKSTLLKLLAGIYAPDKGMIQINGTLTPFIELGVGFNPELTGRENVFLNGALLGLNRKEMLSRYDEIVAFAELERFMDQKLKNFSSGMQVRLAFSIAIHSQQGGILLVDEVLAVGDERFQSKCYDAFRDIKKDPTKTVVFVSHDMDAVQRFCDRVIVVHDGEIAYSGKPEEAALLYKRLNFPDEVVDDNGVKRSLSEGLRIRLQDANGKPCTTFTHNDTMVVDLEWKADSRAAFLGVAIHRDDGVYVFGPNNTGKKRAIPEGVHKAQYEVALNLGTGRYYVEVAVFGTEGQQKVYYELEGPHFNVNNPSEWPGITELPHKWHIGSR